MTFLNNSERVHLSARTQPNMSPNMSNTFRQCSTYLVTYLVVSGQTNVCAQNYSKMSLLVNTNFSLVVILI